VALSPAVPGFLAQTARASIPDRDARTLVVIQLDGGNDGINTVVPYSDEGYAANRRQLRLPADDLIKLTGDVGLHPRLKSASELVEDGRLAIVEGVGYPNPNRSHFESIAIWQSASLDEEQHDGPGWLGQAVSRVTAPRPHGPDTIYVGTGELPMALHGRRCNSATIATADDLELKLTELESGRPASSEAPELDLAGFVQRSVLAAYASARQLSSASSPSAGPYPNSHLASQLKLISQLMKSGAAARVYYTAQSGYDTHAVQLPTHANLLGELSSSLKAFLDDLKVAGLDERVLVLAFSEFGRRVKENGSLGTDHGTAGPVFLAGPGVRAGLHGDMPSLTDLADGDLVHAIDFRRVYATILDEWLELPRPAAMAKFEPMAIIHSA
jgi:uncharacterized protein (DUF1501 family)